MTTDYEARIAEWLGNDTALRGETLALLRQATGLEDLNPLKSWAQVILFDPGYGVVVDDLAWITSRGGDVAAAEKIRNEVGAVLFSAANWDRVCRLVTSCIDKEM